MADYPLYNLKNRAGFTVSILPLGASIQKITVTLKKGREIPLALSFPEIRPYRELVCYAGATLGPNAGRIKNASLPVLGKNYPLSENDNGSQLHGGRHNLSSILWNVDSVTCDSDCASVLLSASQEDGVDGYPGRRRYQVQYTFTESGYLTINYTAWTDQPTYINLSNHTYWNLSGDFSRPALGHELAIYGDRVCINDENHLPVDIIPTYGTSFDFQSPRSLAFAIDSASDPVSKRQLQIGRGYNHAWLLQKPDFSQKTECSPSCFLRDPVSGRGVRLFTDAPGIVLYSGGYLPGNLLLLGGQRSVPSCAIALEAQDLPDTVHFLPDFCQLTLPQKPFQRTIQYQMLLP